MNIKFPSIGARDAATALIFAIGGLSLFFFITTRDYGSLLHAVIFYTLGIIAVMTREKGQEQDPSGNAFDEWLLELQIEFLSEGSERTIAAEGWREEYEQGLTPQQAIEQFMGELKDDKEEWKMQ